MVKRINWGSFNAKLLDGPLDGQVREIALESNEPQGELTIPYGEPQPVINGPGWDQVPSIGPPLVWLRCVALRSPAKRDVRGRLLV
jgi:hypothetical protein